MALALQSRPQAELFTSDRSPAGPAAESLACAGRFDSVVRPTGSGAAASLAGGQRLQLQRRHLRSNANDGAIAALFCAEEEVISNTRPELSVTNKLSCASTATPVGTPSRSGKLPPPT